jgi:hypothetical protein
MLFLYRPRQTWMPYRLPRQRTQQAAYNRQLQDQFEATRRVPPSGPAASQAGSGGATGGAGSTSTPDVATRLKDLAQMHADGVLSDDEFAAAKARVLSAPDAP